MKFFALGINHRTAPLELRETLWLSAAEVQQAVSLLKTELLSECAIVSTCNRTEVYGLLDGIATQRDQEELIQEMLAVLRKTKAVSHSIGRSHFYFLASCAATRHLFKVATGIDSMVLGDVQILSQIKEAFQIASSSNTLGPFLHRLMQSTYHVAKRARTETAIAEGAVSVSYAAVELVSKIFADVSSKSALLIGAGETGELTAKHLAARGIGHLVVTNRTRSKAEDIVAPLGGTVVEFDAFREQLELVDIVISSVTSPEHILTTHELQTVMKNRSHRPLVMIDLGVPRNVEPKAKTVENLFLYDVDSLQDVVDQNLQRRKAEIPRVNAIVIEELREFSSWLKSLEIVPTINDLRAHFELIRSEEVAKHINRFTEHDRELMELVSKRIINKLLHNATVELKNNHGVRESDKIQMLQVVRRLFGLEKSNEQDVGKR